MAYVDIKNTNMKHWTHWCFTGMTEQFTDIEHNFQLVQALKWHYKIVMYSFANFRQHNKEVYDDNKLSI